MLWNVSPSDFISQNSAAAAERSNSDLRREARREMEEFERSQRAFKEWQHWKKFLKERKLR